jgi:hypothetical protein
MMLAVQDFRRASQGQRESIADYIRRLEKMFRTAYGREGMSQETREALLYSQMQEGLMESPAVSGATNYKQLCLSARTEEKRLIDLEKRRRFLQPKPPPAALPTSNPGQGSAPVETARPTTNCGSYTPMSDRRCYNCGRPGHLSRDCDAPRTESRGRRDTNAGNSAGDTRGATRLVTTLAGGDPQAQESDITNLFARVCILHLTATQMEYVKCGSQTKAADHSVCKSLWRACLPWTVGLTLLSWAKIF